MAAAAVLGLSIAAAGAQPVPLPRAAVEADFTRLNCFVDLDEALRNQQRFDLGGGKRLVLVLCLQGAYQGSSIAYAIDGDAPPRLLDFPEWERGRLVPSAFVTEAAFDPVTQEMTAFAKGRGLGDCGSLGTWRWNGTAFTLKTFFNKEKCDGRLFEGQERWRVFPPRKKK
ncbi:MAG: DUF1176 domain-containing protein [Pseudolabrys sp.]|nr:DUF1176 domain-containing protein [Pseudolabrys sp.]